MENILSLHINYALHSNFRQRLSEIGIKVLNTVEVVNSKVLMYIIDCPKELESDVTDLAFMTWIKNPVFQKYYHGTKEYEAIKEAYLLERELKQKGS